MTSPRLGLSFAAFNLFSDIVVKVASADPGHVPCKARANLTEISIQQPCPQTERRSAGEMDAGSGRLCRQP
jgi:hypothetical protein